MFKAGMQAVTKGIERPQTQLQLCHELAGRIRGEINSLHAAVHGPIAGRPLKKEQARQEARIDGMKFALAIAMGIPMDYHEKAIESFLQAFRMERLKGFQSDRGAEATAREGARLAEKNRVLRAAPTEGVLANRGRASRP